MKIYILFLIPLYLLPVQAIAQITCVSDVSYLWKRSEQPQTVSVPTETPTDSVGSSAKIDSNISVPWIRLERDGADEASVKAQLETVLIRERKKALEECKREHESLSTCMGAGYEKMVSVLSGASFSARKTIENSIESDCRAALGLCMNAVSSEIKCESAATPTPEGGAEGESSGKEAKKKK